MNSRSYRPSRRPFPSGRPLWAPPSARRDPFRPRLLTPWRPRLRQKINLELNKSFENLKACLAEICKAIAPDKTVAVEPAANLEQAKQDTAASSVPADGDVDMEERKAGVKRIFDTLFAEGGDLAHILADQRGAIVRAAEESVTQVVAKAFR